MGFSEDKENPSGGAGFNPRDRAHGTAVAFVFVKGAEKLELKGLEEIPTGLKDWE